MHSARATAGPGTDGELGSSQEAQDHVEPFRRLADAIPHVFWITQLDPERVIYVSPSFEPIYGRTQQELYDDPRVWTQCIHPEDRASVEAQFVEWITGDDRTCRKLEYRIVHPSGALRWVTDHGVVTYDSRGKAVRVSGVSTDITELKLAEREQLSHLWFLESLDQVNQAIQGTNDLEQMMDAVLEAVLKSFNCDRAWLAASCDLDAPGWEVVVEHARPPFARAEGPSHAATDGAAHVLSRVRDKAGVARFGPESDAMVPADLAAEFRVRAMLCTALNAKAGTRYVLGIHQCSHARTFTREDEHLFREIGRRLADALGTLWTFRSLRESEARLEAAQRQAHLGYWAVDLDTGRVTWSNETYRIYGIPQDEKPLRIDDIGNLVHPGDQERVNEAAAQAGLSGTYVVDFRALRPNSELRYLHSEGHVVRDAAGRPISFFGTVQDITERKRAEQLLSAQHAVTKLLAEATTAEEATPRILEAVCNSLAWDMGAVWRIDETGKMLRCHELWRQPAFDAPRFEAATRAHVCATDVELPGRVWSNRKPSFISDVAFDGNLLRASVASAEGVHAAFAFPVLVGSELWGVMEFFSLEVRQQDPDLLTTMATLGSQIGQFVERKRAEIALQNARDQLAHVTRVASLGEMTASIAHEVNQPLTGIIANAHSALRWLSREPPEVSEAVESIQRLARDGNRAGEVVGRLRSLIRKNDQVRKTGIDVNQVVRETLPLVRSEIQRNDVAVRMKLSACLPSVFADRVQVQQVMLNLIINAVEAMATVRDRPRELLIRSADHCKDTILFGIEDTGVGLQPEIQARIFDAFFTTKPQGMGMGLAISRSIVEEHGGRLWVTPRGRCGSVFEFTLRKDLAGLQHANGTNGERSP